jgi:hypothetical protein
MGLGWQPVQHVVEEQDEQRRQESMWLLQAMNECAPRTRLTILLMMHLDVSGLCW